MAYHPEQMPVWRGSIAAKNGHFPSQDPAFLAMASFRCFVVCECVPTEYLFNCPKNHQPLDWFLNSYQRAFDTVVDVDLGSLEFRINSHACFHCSHKKVGMVIWEAIEAKVQEADTIKFYCPWVPSSKSRSHFIEWALVQEFCISSCLIHQSCIKKSSTVTSAVVILYWHTPTYIESDVLMRDH